MRPVSLERPVPSTLRPDFDSELGGVFRLDDEDAAELLLVHHAAPDVSPAARAEFGSDAPLSCAGRAQVLSLAQRLSAGWVEAVYTGPERRAVETASILAYHLERPVYLLHDLRDIDYEPTGLPFETFPLLRALSARYAARPRWDALPGFEESAAFRSRAIAAVESVLAAHPARRSVIVSHTSVINAYLSMLLDIPRDLFFAPDHASVSVVRSLADVYAVRSLNDTSHLLHGGCDELLRDPNRR